MHAERLSDAIERALTFAMIYNLLAIVQAKIETIMDIKMIFSKAILQCLTWSTSSK